MSLALLALLDTRNHPLLIHCNKGKHRTGCMVGVLRRALGWSLASIFDEYRLFSAPKERFMDQQFIELWQMTLPNEHPIMMRARRQKEAVAAVDGGEPAAAGAEEENSADATALSLLLDYTPYLLNPEANDHLQRTRDKEKDSTTRSQPAVSGAAAAGSVNVRPSLHHASSERMTHSQRPLGATHHHTHSHPDLSTILKRL